MRSETAHRGLALVLEIGVRPVEGDIDADLVAKTESRRFGSHLPRGFPGRPPRTQSGAEELALDTAIEAGCRL